jgi:hypothetical protein
VGTVLIQPSSLSQVVYRIGDTLKVVYGIDPVPIYRSVGVNPDGPGAAGERQPNRVIDAMFDAAARASGDPALGLRVGLQSEPRHFFVLGHAWFASATLADAFRALLRYEAILNSGHTDLCFERQGEHYVLREAYPNPADYPGKLRVDTAELVRRPPNVEVHDPWWDYRSGDFRLFPERLVELRRMAR